MLGPQRQGWTTTTSAVPIRIGWNSQKYVKVPTDLNVLEYTLSGPKSGDSQMKSREPGKVPPDPEVEVWATTPVLVQRTVSPTEIVIFNGMIENNTPLSCNETLWTVPAGGTVVVVVGGGGGKVVVVVGGGSGKVVVAVGAGSDAVVVVGDGAVVVAVGAGSDAVVVVGGGGTVVAEVAVVGATAVVVVPWSVSGSVESPQAVATSVSARIRLAADLVIAITSLLHHRRGGGVGRSALPPPASRVTGVAQTPSWPRIAPAGNGALCRLT